MALEDIKKELDKKLKKAEANATPNKEEVSKTQYKQALAENRKNKIEDINTALGITNDLREKVADSFDELIKALKVPQTIEAAGFVFQKIQKDNEDWAVALKGHETAINAGDSKVKDALSVSIKDTLKLWDDSNNLWVDLCKDYSLILAGMEDGKGIGKMLEDQKAGIKDAFEIDLLAEGKDAEKNYKAAQKAFENATKAQKDNQDEISSLKDRLKLF